MELKGVYTAMVTPLSKGAVDYGKLREIVEMQIQGGVDGIVPVGTTGESPTLDAEEHMKVIEETIAAAAGRYNAGIDNVRETELSGGDGVVMKRESLEVGAGERKAVLSNAVAVLLAAAAVAVEAAPPLGRNSAISTGLKKRTPPNVPT